MDGASPAGLREFAAEVRAGLAKAPKELPTRYLYDALGSRLFEAICQLPWYPLTRAELALLDRHAARMVAPLAAPTRLVELGCGSGEKTAVVAEALCARGGPLVAHLVDVSAEALEQSRRTLAKLPLVTVVGHEHTYEEGLACAARARPERGSLLVVFLGSNIGNLGPEGAHALLSDIRRCLRPGDGLLLGADLVKPEHEILAAYDDPLGVTAAFDKNLLARIDRELGGDFDLDAFAHAAVWNGRESRAEMHLVSLRPQHVRIASALLEVDLREGESIRTECSYKFDPAQIVEMGRRACFRCHDQFIEPAARFATTLFVAA